MPLPLWASSLRGCDGSNPFGEALGAEQLAPERARQRLGAEILLSREKPA